MDKGFGIAALVLAIVAIFVPGFHIFVSGLAIILAVLAALAGDRVFSTATPLIAGANTFFMSPSFWIMAEAARQDGHQALLFLVIFAFVAAPFIAMALNSSGKVVLNSKPGS